MAITNLTGLTNMTSAGFGHIFQYANNITDGLFMSMVVFAFIVIMFISMKRYETEKALLISLFAGLIVSIPLVYVDLINWLFIFINGVGIGLVLLFMHIKGEK